jgi:hypothetical protein
MISHTIDFKKAVRSIDRVLDRLVGQHLIVSDVSGRSQRDLAVERARAEFGNMANPPTIEAVREALSGIPGKLSDDVIAGRGDD